MTLTTNGKNYIAQKFGINNCFVGTGIEWNVNATDGSVVLQTGGTGLLVGQLALGIASSIDITSPSALIGNYTPAMLTSANDGSSVNISSDIQAILAEDGSPPSETQFCYTGTPSTPTPTPAPLPTSGPQQYPFITQQSGNPNVKMNYQYVQMEQDVDYHFKINNLTIMNYSAGKVNFAVEIQLFTGTVSTCGGTNPVFKGADRTSSRSIKVYTLDPAFQSGVPMTKSVDVNIYQPKTIVGVHTVCIHLHAGWNYDVIYNEMAAV